MIVVMPMIVPVPVIMVVIMVMPVPMIMVVPVLVVMTTAIFVPAILMGVMAIVIAVLMAERSGSKVMPESRHRQQMEGKYATHHPTHHSGIALDSHAVRHHSSVHVSFSAFDTVGTRDGFIDGGMLLRRIYTAAVERSRVNFPEDTGTSARKDKSLIPSGNLDNECRFLTQAVRLSRNFRSM
jgi:hypothetical protein